MKSNRQILTGAAEPSLLCRYSLIILLCSTWSSASAQGGFCYSGLETVNFNIIDLSVSAGAGWQTDRLSLPGYFGAVNGASFIGSSDNFNINGYVKKYGNEPFFFPVGSGKDLRGLNISAPAAATDAYATAWIPGDPGLAMDLTMPFAGEHPVTAISSPLVAVSTLGQWDWQVGDAANLGEETTGTGNGLTVTVSIPDMTMFSLPWDLRLAGWDGTKWIDLSGKATANGNTENKSLTGTMVPGITAIAIASIKIPVFSAFQLTGLAGDCSVQLKWKVSDNAGINRFVVEQSADGVTYKEAATLNADRFLARNGYNVVIKQTEFVDYYRLKIIDDNGNSWYSNTVAFQINCGLDENVIVYPNPVRDQEKARLRITTAYRGPIRIMIVNNLGQQLGEVKETISSAITVIPVNGLPVASGIYYISIVKQDGSRLGETQRIIKQQ